MYLILTMLKQFYQMSITEFMINHILKFYFRLDILCLTSSDIAET